MAARSRSKPSSHFALKSPPVSGQTGRSDLSISFFLDWLLGIIFQFLHKIIPGDTIKKKRGTAEEISYYKERGMTNPEDYIKYRTSIPQYIFKIRAKFPAYGKLDKAVMRQITQKADTLIKSM